MAAQTTAWVNFNGKDVGVKISIEGIEKSLNNMQRNGKKGIDSLSASFKNLKSQISSMSGSMGSLPLIGGLGAAGIFAGGKTAVEKFAGRESIETAIGMFSKTEERTASNLAFLKRTSRELGIVYDTAADGYKRLMQNLSSTNMPMEEQNALFKKISTVIRVSNADNTAAESVYRAFGDMFSKGGIQAQELKTQLANAIGGVMPAMKQAFPGMNIASGLDAGAFNKQIHVVKLINQLYENNEKGLDKATKQTSYKLAIIQDNWANAMSSIGKSIVDSGALGVVSDMASELSVWVDANKDMIAASIKGGVDWVKGAFQWAVDNKESILDFFEGFAVFVLTMKGIDLMTSFANPISIAATGMAGIAIAITSAVNDLERAKIIEAKRKNRSDPSTITSMKAGSGFWRGLNYVGEGFGALGAEAITMGVHETDPQRYINMFGGIAMMAAATGQKVLQGVELLNRDKDMGSAGKYSYMAGQFNMGLDQSMSPKEYQNTGESSLSEFISTKPVSRADSASRIANNSDAITSAVLTGIQRGMRESNITVNVDSTGKASIEFGQTVNKPHPIKVAQ